jgi:DNA-binding Xre family transcriptional regulator
MNKPQIITTEHGEELIVLTRHEFDRLRARTGGKSAEDAIEDEVLARIAGTVRKEGGASLPLELWNEIFASTSAVGPIRRFRKMSQQELAAKAGITQPYLSEIENGKKRGDVKTLRAIAKALKVSLGDLTEQEG